MIAFASKSPERFSEAVEQIYTEQSLSDLTDELLDGLIANDVNTLLYDGGFRPGQKEEGKSRKKDRGLDMLEAYMKEIGIEPFAVSNRGNVVSLQDGKNKSYGEYYTACNQLRLFRCRGQELQHLFCYDKRLPFLLLKRIENYQHVQQLPLYIRCLLPYIVHTF